MAAYDPGSPDAYNATVSAQSPQAEGAEGGILPATTPAGVLRKQGQSNLRHSLNDRYC